MGERKWCRYYFFFLSLLFVCALGAQPVSALAAPPAMDRLGTSGPRPEAAPPSTGAGEPKIVGGNTTTSSKYPWQVQLEITNSEGSFVCGGTLIHPYIVLTAAHCITDDFGEIEAGTEVLAWLGRTSLSSGGIANEAYDLWTPNAYNPFTQEYDVAFVSLWNEASLPRLQIAGPTERALWTPGRAAAITGWGTTSEGGSLSSLLKEAQVPIVDDATCAQPAINGLDGFEPRTMVCAGFLGGGTDTCQGDSGGPLQSPIDGGGYRLVGVTSWGDGCAQPNKPGVYTRIASDPIESFIAEAIPFIEVEDEIPITGVNVIGAGARPPGCGVAESQLAAATTASAAADANLKGRQGKLRNAKRSVTKASRGVRSATAARKRGVRRAGVKLRLAKKRLKTANRKLKASRKRVGVARSSAATSAAALAAAGANRAVVCG
jgi:secreted trypsin-like serine protease